MAGEVNIPGNPEYGRPLFQSTSVVSFTSIISHNGELITDDEDLDLGHALEQECCGIQEYLVALGANRLEGSELGRIHMRKHPDSRDIIGEPEFTPEC
jgi:hypothetical protein